MPTISEFKALLSSGGARPSQFRVELTFPAWVAGGALAGQEAQFLTKAASLPASTISDIELRYRGRAVHLAGEREFQPWNISIYNDNTFNIRGALETWQAGILGYSAIEGRTNPADYQVDAKVHQLDREGNIVKSYKFYDIYPTEVGTIGLDYDASNTIEIFDCNLVFNYFEPI